MFVAAPGLVDSRGRYRFGVFVVGFLAELLVEERLVVVPAAGHHHIGHRSRGALAQNRVGAVGGHALRRVHGRRVAQRDVFFEVVGLEDGAGGGTCRCKCNGDSVFGTI